MTTLGAPNSTPGYASASLYVGDLAQDVTEALLFEVFNAVGPVASVRVCRDTATRRSLGYAYVNFHRVEDAERALDTMNFTTIRSKPCRIMWSHRDPALRRSGVGNIFVKNLAKTIDNKSLYDTFSVFGNILSCKVAQNSKGESLGYGFVHYEADDSASAAISRCDGIVLAGEKITVAPFKSKQERGGDSNTKFTNIYVKHLADDVTKDEVDALFSKFGNITSSLLISKDGKPAGFGFVNYGTPEEAAAAIEKLNNFEFHGKKLYVARAQKKDAREKELREKFEQFKQERQKKYAGVNLYVKNLTDTITDDGFTEFFSKFGDITSAKLMKDSAGKSRGFGFVCFSTPEEATKAISETNGKMFDGKPLYVALAQPKEVRRAQLEAQHSARSKGQPQQLFPPQGAPMYYQGVPAQRNYVYQQQLVPRRWNSATPQMMRLAGHPVNYQLMPLSRPPHRGAGAGRGAHGARTGIQAQPAPRANTTVAATVPTTATTNGAVQSIPASTKPSEPLTIKALAAAPEEQQKQMIGERLFPLIRSSHPQLAGKITGMLLEMDNGELLHLLESSEALGEKISEALQVLKLSETPVTTQITA